MNDHIDILSLLDGKRPSSRVGKRSKIKKKVTFSNEVKTQNALLDTNQEANGSEIPFIEEKNADTVTSLKSTEQQYFIEELASSNLVDSK